MSVNPNAATVAATNVTGAAAPPAQPTFEDVAAFYLPLPAGRIAASLAMAHTATPSSAVLTQLDKVSHDLRTAPAGDALAALYGAALDPEFFLVVKDNSVSVAYSLTVCAKLAPPRLTCLLDDRAGSIPP